MVGHPSNLVGPVPHRPYDSYATVYYNRTDYFLAVMNNYYDIIMYYKWCLLKIFFYRYMWRNTLLSFLFRRVLKIANIIIRPATTPRVTIAMTIPTIPPTEIPPTLAPANAVKLMQKKIVKLT